MPKYKGKNYNPNYKKELQDFQKLKNIASSQNSPDPEYGKPVKPHVGMIFDSDIGYVNLFNILDSTTEFTFEDAELVDSDPIVNSYREKLLGSAASQKSSYDFNQVAEPVAEFAKNLKNELDWATYHRAGYSSSKYGMAVIQVLWETVKYEIIGDTIYPKTQRIYGFKQEDYRNFEFNRDLTLGNYGDIIYTPLRINITKKYPYNFITIINKPDAIHPEGNSDFKELKNIIVLKNFLLKTQARYIKKATVPSFVAIYKSGLKGSALTLEANSISALLSSIENGAGVALPNVSNIVTLMPTAQTDFIRILSYIDNVIQLKILGTSLLGGQSEKGGSYASAKVGATELQDSIKQVALTLQNIDNIIIKYAIWQRFGTDTKLPQLLFDLTEESPLADYEFMAKWKLPVEYTALVKRFPMASGVKEPKGKMWYLGSPDGLLENITAEGTAKPVLTEEQRLAEDAQRKQDEEDENLKKVKQS
jgi:hypothetical protein